MFDQVATQLLVGWAIVAGLMTALWVIERATKNAGVVDVGWSAGVGLLAVFLAATTPGDATRRWLIGGLLAVWSLRLAVYLLFDRVLGREEDGRYQTLRAKWGRRAGGYFFLFFQAQALLALVFALPAVVAMRTVRDGFSWLDGVGVGIWLVAICGEALADRQLAHFRADAANRGRTCRAGLWRYSRHPNYFFEWLHWWTYVVLAVGSPWWWVTLVGPALMLFLLFKVTGIPATEAQAVASRGEDYRRYQRTTSAFVPWFPKHDAAANVGDSLRESSSNSRSELSTKESS